MSTDGPATGPGAPPPLVAWLWRYVRPHRGKFLAALVLMALEGSMLGALSWSIRPMFDRVFIGGDRLALGLVAGGLLTVFVVRGLAGFGQRVLMVMIGQRVAARIQSDMVRHLVGLDSAYFLETPPGTLIERVRGDSAAATTLPAGVVAALGRDGVSLLSLFLVALWIDWLWTLIALAAAPLIMLPAGRLHRRVGAAARQGRVIAARLATHLDETFHGINAIKLSGTEARAGDRYDAEIGGFVRAQVRAERNQAGISALMDIIAGVGLFGVLSYGGAQIIAGTRTVGDFMAFFTAMGLVFEPLRRIGNVAGVWAAARASLERLHAILALRPTILGPAAPVALPARVAAADIVFDDVHFAYGETPALRGLGFTARAGQTTALVGPSGAGKSTVFTLLARLADPQAGAITLGGVAIDRFALADLRGVFSVVAQDTALFDESLRENIVMGADCTAEALAAAVEAAHVREFAAALPQGLETRVGPRGAALSGGQRQRVAIARALLRDSPVLLLDEATSALDAASEAAVQGALARLSAGRTTLVIAHRLATIAGADRILVLDGGRVVDSGTHHELLARGGLYAALCGTQFAGT